MINHMKIYFFKNIGEAYKNKMAKTWRKVLSYDIAFKNRFTKGFYLILFSKMFCKDISNVICDYII